MLVLLLDLLLEPEMLPALLVVGNRSGPESPGGPHEFSCFSVKESARPLRNIIRMENPGGPGI